MIDLVSRPVVRLEPPYAILACGHKKRIGRNTAIGVHYRCQPCEWKSTVKGKLKPCSHHSQA
ncbi:hypothetical protein LLG88_13445 [bacterium]|nr:hypothetical protein [bacterium]